MFWLLLGCLCAPVHDAAGQIRVARAAAAKSSPRPADTPQPTALTLDLCVEGTTLYPCPTPVTLDDTYIPNITLTYGQILDGVVAYSPDTITSGTITIYDYANTVCVLRIGIDQQCPANSTIFDFGPHVLTAALTFPAGSSFADSMAAQVNVSVAKDTSSITLSSSANPATLGSAVTITALAKGGYTAVPTGQVVLTQDGMELPPIPIDATGAANFTTSTLSLGTHTFQASYAGALDFNPAPDPTPLPQVITPPSTVTTLASSISPSLVGESVTFTASVATAAGLNVTPTGAVTFKDGAVAFGTVVVTPKGGLNTAQTTISTLAVGTHNITAAYSGDAATSASNSPVLVQQVNYPLSMPPPGYTITVKPSQVTMGVGETTDLTVTVTPLGGYSATVTLSCSNLPSESACTFADAVIPAGGGSTNMALSTMAPHDCGSNAPYFRGSAGLHQPSSPVRPLGYAAPVLAGVFLLVQPRRRRWGKGLFALIAVCGLFGLGGCSSRCTDFGTYPGSYTFKVNGTSSVVTPVVTGGAPAATYPGAINVSTSVGLSVKL